MKKIILTMIAILTFIFGFVFIANAKILKKTTSSNLTCAYFDSLRNNFNCETFNKGKPIEVKPSGKNKDLYLTTYKIINSDSFGRDATENSGGVIPFAAIKIDLNNDGIDEAILFPCNMYFVGTTGLGEFYIFQKRSNKWKLIGDMLGMLLNIDKERTNNYFNIITYENNGATESVLSISKLNNRSGKYKTIERKLQLCTSKSAKPCYEPPERYK